MPRFFFSSRDHYGTSLDEEGMEFPSASKAHTQAVIFAGDLIKELAASSTDDTLLALWVTDADGRTVCSIDFSVACGTIAPEG